MAWQGNDMLCMKRPLFAIYAVLGGGLDMYLCSMFHATTVALVTVVQQRVLDDQWIMNLTVRVILLPKPNLNYYIRFHLQGLRAATKIIKWSNRFSVSLQSTYQNRYHLTSLLGPIYVM